VLKPIHAATKQRDGYVSLEVSPDLAHDTSGTTEEARRLWKAVARENVMIKVPATLGGIPAIRQLISEGINVNVTLLFAMEAYERVVEAYIAGLAARRALNGRQIARLSAQAAQAAAETQSPGSRPEPQPEESGPKPGGSQMVVDVVAYCGGVGTASGLPLGWGTVAVDTRVFPFGTRMYIPGYGDGVAADTGSAIIGRIIDIWFPTCAQARAWGRQTLTITVYW